MKILKFFSAVLLRAVRFFLTGKWCISIKKIHKTLHCNKSKNNRGISPPQDRFYADPFILKKGNLNYIFYEDYEYEKGKGVISCISIDETGAFTEYTAVLERDYHLSYPFVFEWEDQIYMIPETSENKRIEMYRATDFPQKWTLEKVLMDNIIAVDTTLVKYNNLYWLFAGVANDDDNLNTDLHLYYSDSPFGQWKPHPCNPIVSDSSRARPAGKLFFEGCKLMRPGQDCSMFYGFAIQIHRIEVLNEINYHEVPVKKIRPSLLRGRVGAHTYNFNTDYEVVDYKAVTIKGK